MQLLDRVVCKGGFQTVVTQRKVGLDMEMTLHTTTHRKLNVSNISALNEVSGIQNNYKNNKTTITSTTKIPQSGICPALCVLCQCTVVFA